MDLPEWDALVAAAGQTTFPDAPGAIWSAVISPLWLKSPFLQRNSVTAIGKYFAIDHGGMSLGRDFSLSATNAQRFLFLSFVLETNMKSYRIATIPGDGIGKEVVPEGIRVLETAGRKHGFTLQWTQLPWSCEFYQKTGQRMTADGR